MFLMPDNKWARLLSYVTGLVNQKLLLQNEYLAGETASCECYGIGELKRKPEGISQCGGSWKVPITGYFRKCGDLRNFGLLTAR